MTPKTKTVPDHDENHHPLQIQEDTTTYYSSNSNEESKLKLPLWTQQCSLWGEKLHFPEWDDYVDLNHHNHNHGHGQNDCNPTTYDDHDTYSTTPMVEKQSVSSYRSENGWKGHDLVHSKHSAIRVLQYRIQYDPTNSIPFTPTSSTTTPISLVDHNSIITNNNNTMTHGTTLTGIVHFTPQAESHKQYCHGGSMCTIMDDVIGWTAFCVTGKCIPWSGYTVQINTKLMKPIAVNSILKVICVVEKVVGRKVYCKAKLIHPNFCAKKLNDFDFVGSCSSCERLNCECGDVHAESEGIVVLHRGII